MMRPTLTYCLLLLTANISLAQDSIQLKRLSWAGGVCCSTGDNFYLNIPKSIARKGFDSLWVYIPGTRIHVSSGLFSSENPTSATFGWAIYTEDESYNANGEKTYQGIVKTDAVLSIEWSLSKKAMVFLSNGKTKEIPISYSGESVAYP